MRITSTLPNPTAFARVILAGALALFITSAASAASAAAAGGFPAPRPDALASELNVPQDLVESLNSLARTKFGADLLELPVRTLMSSEFLKALSDNGRRMYVKRFRAFMAGAGLPTNLDRAETRLFAAQPTHPIFKPFAESGVPTDLLWELGDETPHFLIDLVHGLNATKTGVGYEDLRARVDLVLGEPSRDFHAEKNLRGETHVRELAEAAQRAHVARLNAPASTLGLSPALTAKVESVTKNAYVQTVAQVETRRLLSENFFKLLLATAPASAHAFRAQVARKGFPTNLNHAEMALYYAAPKHPVFTPTEELRLPQAARDQLIDGEDFFVIDSVRALNQLASDEDHAELRRHVDAFLDKSSRHFNPRFELQEEERRRNPAKPTLAECRRVLSSMPLDELQREYAAEVMRRQFPDGLPK